MATPERPSRLRAWLLEGMADRAAQQPGPHALPEGAHQGQVWWRVMCLTGLDYFSTLGYQPGIAALAAGLLSPLATIVLVALTLLGALPVYRRVAMESPHGEGSIAMLERLLSFWQGKLFVLTLLGFAATDFLITITLSAADATAHLVENPHLDSALHGHELLITFILIALLGAVFLKGFGEAIGVAVVLVICYLILNAVVVVDSLWEVFTAPSCDHRLDARADQGTRQPDRHDRNRAGGLPQTGARPVRIRDGRRGHAAHQGPAGRPVREAGRPDPRRAQASHHGRRDHECLPHHQQLRHDPADPGGRLQAGRPGQRTGPRLPRPPAAGLRLRQRLRRLHHSHPVVRRRLRHGGPAQPDAALSAPVRHGPAAGPARCARW